MCTLVPPAVQSQYPKYASTDLDEGKKKQFRKAAVALELLTKKKGIPVTPTLRL